MKIGMASVEDQVPVTANFITTQSVLLCVVLESLPVYTSGWP